MKNVKIILCNLLLLFALLLLCEMGFRLLRPDYQFYEQAVASNFHRKAAQFMDTNWVQQDSLFGWVCQQKKHLKFYLPEYHNIYYQINPQGFRMPFDLDSLPPPSDSTRRILLLGDSFLFGIFLSEEHTIANCLQEKLGPGYQVFNLSAPAWGLDQMYIAHQQYHSTLEPDMSMLLYIDEDVTRIVEGFFWGAATKPSFVLRGEELQAKPPTEGLLNAVEEMLVFSSKMANVLYKTSCQQQAKPLAVKLLSEMAEAEQQQGRELKLMRCPRVEQIGPHHQGAFDLRDQLAKRNLTVYDLVDTIRQLPHAQQQALYLPKDTHPSAQGAAFICGILERQIREQLEGK